ncbi:ATP-binding cassette domain-containing protein [Helicobacter mesocricetorum]|uniref:ATP-binding cassette domain-containing protein n=1 Tax=Helicobacter mesocricetorum TaxID=87012 RepID=UPI000CF17581|nr:dipeptide/oligopeptide/nickel ABC transporter ATP-binding protein [Helicobacter mesocricetorum]
MRELIRVDGVSQYYKKGNFFSKAPLNVALEKVSFSLFENRNLGILGRNGAGKSSLVRILLGLEKPKSGQVRMFFDKKQERRLIQAVFQDPQSSLNPRWSARKCLLEGLENFKMLKNPKDQSEELAELVGLPKDSLDKKSFEFSGGEQQRINLARVLALQPRVLILDEALSNLDVHLQMKMIEMLKSLQKQLSITYLVISHDLRIILQLCEDVLLLRDGKVVFKTNKQEGIYNAILRDSKGDSAGYFNEFYQASFWHLR